MIVNINTEEITLRSQEIPRYCHYKFDLVYSDISNTAELEVEKRFT